jgi:hypothetical protein
VTAFAPFAPLTVASFAQGLGTDGWDAGQTVRVDGGPAGPVLVSLDAAELPSNEGAAGFLQTRLQQRREDTTKDNMAGDLEPADAKLTGDADEAYFGVFVSPDTAQDRAVMAVLIVRYENQVVATTTTIHPDAAGTISVDAQRGLGVVLGVLAQQINGLASE